MNEDRVADLLSIWSLPGVHPGYPVLGPATELLVPVHLTASLATHRTMACLDFLACPEVPGPIIFTPLLLRRNLK